MIHQRTPRNSCSFSHLAVSVSPQLEKIHTSLLLGQTATSAKLDASGASVSLAGPRQGHACKLSRTRPVAIPRVRSDGLREAVDDSRRRHAASPCKCEFRL